VVLTTGTFLRGVIIRRRGVARGRARRRGPGACRSRSPAAAGVSLARLKTGTPCRLDGRTIDSDRAGACRPATSRRRAFVATDPVRAPPLPQVPCYMTHTTGDARADSDNLHRSPLYAGRGSLASGRATARRSRTRWCASPTSERHQIFLEPEGWTPTRSIPTGCRRACPPRSSWPSCAAIPGPRRRRDLRPGYAVEYDFAVPPDRCYRRWLETRGRGLYPRRPDQRDLGLRGGRGAGAVGRGQCGAEAARGR
jgi:tRNA uridine 5-carboxymethylaminomethyl modification enzyme